MRFCCFLLLLFSATNLWAQKNRLDVTPVAPGFWVHTSYGKYKNTFFPANGLIVEHDGFVWIVDTGWGKRPARKLIRWVKKHLHKPIDLVIITHAHDDRAGGLAVFQQQKIPLYMTAQTAEILQKQHVVLPQYQALCCAGGMHCNHEFCFAWEFPGAGHAPDNIVVYFKETQLLFGGCFIKSLEAQNLGNLADASLTEWPKALRQVQAHFPDMRIVIPGHQAWGGPELLEHTLKLLETMPK